MEHHFCFARGMECALGRRNRLTLMVVGNLPLDLEVSGFLATSARIPLRAFASSTAADGVAMRRYNINARWLILSRESVVPFVTDRLPTCCIGQCSDSNQVRTSVPTSKSGCARAPCDDLTPARDSRDGASAVCRSTWSTRKRFGRRRPSARSSMSAGGGVRSRSRSARQDGAVWRRSPRSRGSRARPSVGAERPRPAPLPKGRVRRKGGGRRHLWSRDATLIEDLRSVISRPRSAIPCARCRSAPLPTWRAPADRGGPDLCSAL